MKISLGIIGLPNVGKSTLFNALLKKQQALVANYPFATIEPNVGVVPVPDERLPVLAKIVNTEKIFPAVVEFYDIAGLVKGASEGAGLGNKFLSHIREVAAVAHVVRLFEDDNVIHVSNTLDPLDDLKTVETELVLADLATLEKQIAPRMNATKEEKATYEVVQKVKEELNQTIPVRQQRPSDEELASIRHLNLLTVKPVLYVCNVSENQLANFGETEKKAREVLQEYDPSCQFILLCAKLEAELVALSPDEQTEYLKQFNLTESGLNRLIRASYTLLHLVSFLTAGEKEVQAWTIPDSTLAPQAAAVIHTDFEKHFIKADVIPYQSFVESQGWVKAREKGLVVSAGKEYAVKDGDVVEFKIGS